MALHFSAEEYDIRKSRTMEKLTERGLDGLLMFRQESMYYLSGYDSFGYVFFHTITGPETGPSYLYHRGYSDLDRQR